MRVPTILRCVIGFLCLWSLVGTPEVAAQDASVVSSGGLSGRRLVPPGAEIQIYFIELTEIALGADAEVKRTGAGPEEIRFSISDHVAFPTGLAGTDITAFNFYRSADAVFDGGDIFTGKSTGFGGPGALTIDLSGAPFLNDIPDAPASIFFIITAQISPNATIGTRFRLALPALHIDIREFGPGLIYTLGSAIADSDANYIQIQIGESRRRSTKIPVGLEWLVGLGFFGYGIYWLLRNRRGTAVG